MEGKSLFTCHQCGALLKFQYSPVSIEEKIMRLRPVAYEHPVDPGEQRFSKGEEEDQGARLTEGTDAGETTDADEEEEVAASAPTVRSSLSQQQQQQQKTSAVVPEIVWERQHLDISKESGAWMPAEFDLMNGIAAFTSCNRGDIGQSIADVVPARLLNKSHLWMSDWKIDLSLPQCDREGWVYAASYAAFGAIEGLAASEKEVANENEHSSPAAGTDACSQVRQRRLIRKRRIDGSDLCWFQELLDCRYA